ncbi:MAG: polyprenyl synthetase family protein [Anaerolineales bacterium]|jgi:geranylgeranyl pyrophosphate synthase
MNSTTATFNDLTQTSLQRVESLMRSNPDGNSRSLNEAVDHLIDSGGKRVRPMMVILIGNALGAPEDRLTTLAAAIEMLHTATLVHDDLIDNSLLRRGTPTINAQWSLGAAVLTGDFMFARAAQLAAQTGSLLLMEKFAQTLMTIVNGELDQLLPEQDVDLRQDYLNRIYAKTGSLFEVASEGAAIISQADAATNQAMKQFGYNLGIAFQVIDDVLDFTSSQDQIGKPNANDLRQGLITLPTIYYLDEQANRRELLNRLRTNQFTSDELDKIIEGIKESDAIEDSINEAQEYIETALKALEELPVSAEREALNDLASFIVKRLN